MAEFRTQSEEARRIKDLINRMLDSEQFEWAREKLVAIYDDVLEHGRVTPGQRKAIDNIAKARGGSFDSAQDNSGRDPSSKVGMT